MPFRILVVDDETDHTDTLTRLLRRFGHTCLTAVSAAEAIGLIHAESPQLVMTDLHMPGMDGLAVARYARDKNPPIPVILMTANPTHQTQAHSLTLGGTLYLGKPFANADFLKAVEEALAST